MFWKGFLACWFLPKRKTLGKVRMSDSSGKWKFLAEGFLIGSLVCLGVVLTYRLLDRPQQSGIALVPPPPTVTPRPTSTPSPLYVDVSGAVRTPGVFRLPAGSRVQDAIDKAGGVLPDADLDAVNLAAKLIDGAKVYVPHIGEPAADKRSGKSVKLPTPTVQFPIDINKATVEELEALPRIGPSLAKRIVENRPYDTIEDIMRVPGIGRSTFEKIKEKITVGK
jgi:competence protein ComEA